MKRRWMAGPVLVAFGALLLSGATAVAQTRAVRLKSSMTAAEFERCGLQKLTPAELSALEEWISTRASFGGTRTPSATQGLAGGLAEGTSRSGEIVAFNTSNGKYHCSSCQWALRCTRNCVNIPLSEARARGVPCKVCGGSCR